MAVIVPAIMVIRTLEMVRVQAHGVIIGLEQLVVPAKQKVMPMAHIPEIMLITEIRQQAIAGAALVMDGFLKVIPANIVLRERQPIFVAVLRE